MNSNNNKKILLKIHYLIIFYIKIFYIPILIIKVKLKRILKVINNNLIIILGKFYIIKGIN